MDINKLNEMKFSLGKLDIHAAFVNHPGVCAGYRIFTSGGSVAFLPDHEPYEFFLHAARGKQLSSEDSEKNCDGPARCVGSVFARQPTF